MSNLNSIISNYCFNKIKQNKPRCEDCNGPALSTDLWKLKSKITGKLYTVLMCEKCQKARMFKDMISRLKA